MAQLEEVFAELFTTEVPDAGKQQDETQDGPILRKTTTGFKHLKAANFLKEKLMRNR